MPRDLAIVAMLLLGVSLASVARGQDNPILRSILERKLFEELAEHSTQETAWFNEKSKDRQKWTSGKLFGRPIRLASWTEQSKSWIWLEDPKKTLTLKINQFTIQDGRLVFSVGATAQARFRVWGRIPKLIQANVGGTAHVYIDIAGSTTIGDGHLTDSKVTVFKVRMEDLQLNNDAAHPLEDLVKDALNDYANDKNEKLRTSVEKAINRIRL